MKKKRQLKAKVAARNTVVQNPLLRKSGAHEKTRKAKRRSDRVAMQKTWFERGAVIAASGQSHVSAPAFG